MTKRSSQVWAATPGAPGAVGATVKLDVPSRGPIASGIYTVGYFGENRPNGTLPDGTLTDDSAVLNRAVRRRGTSAQGCQRIESGQLGGRSKK